MIKEFGLAFMRGGAVPDLLQVHCRLVVGALAGAQRAGAKASCIL